MTLKTGQPNLQQPRASSCAALYPGVSSRPRLSRLDPHVTVSCHTRSAIAGINVAHLRTEAGRDPHSKPLHDLVGELSTRSDHLLTLWGRRHDVWEHQSGGKRFHHRAVGALALHFNGLDLVGESGVQLTVLTAGTGITRP
ncbi:hypothetical protein Q9R08_20175 [Microbacterium sp. QXD-8]|uniref:MmyB-like transcription regulator ligand binding domain-containing protein n=1 Tax=Microbacterium psychrotolerans TaxID=3068321 RepID=A0ABU0Z8Y8_9MICO|nr:hypothetical protein [Microbacterium sp. QXD-8]MDQ7880316.1 hypothetical protein [Microbacterium sp. QXD-8]